MGGSRMWHSLGFDAEYLKHHSTYTQGNVTTGFSLGERFHGTTFSFSFLDVCPLLLKTVVK